MAVRESNSVALLTITYSGGVAEQGYLPVDELAISLHGWQDLLRLAESSIVNGQLSFPRPKANPSNLVVRKVRQGSIDVEVAYDLAVGTTSGLITAGVLFTIAQGFKFVRGIYNKILTIESAEPTPDDIVRALEELANENDIQLPDGAASRESIAVHVHAAFEEASRPVGSATEQIKASIQSDEEPITITLAEREKLRQPLKLSSESDEYSAVITISGINKRTGHVRFRFTPPNQDVEKGSQTGYIVDSRVRKNENPYTESLHLGNPLAVRIEIDELRPKGKCSWRVKGLSGHDSGNELF